MMARLSARERRLIALLMLVAAVAAVWLGVVSPIISGFAARADDRQRLAAHYANNERLLASIGRLRALAVRQRADQARYRLVASTPLAADEILKERLSDTVAQAGGQPRSTQEVDAGPGQVRAWIEARMSLPQLAATLAALENQTPLLALTSLSVAADQSASDRRADVLDVRIEVSARYDHAHPR